MVGKEGTKSAHQADGTPRAKLRDRRGLVSLEEPEVAQCCCSGECKGKDGRVKVKEDIQRPGRMECIVKEPDSISRAMVSHRRF